MASIKAVAYYRMSSDKQEASIADQRVAVEEYASKNGYMIIREYLDEGISGWKADQRKGFTKLIEDVSSGDFKAVLCWDQDRFSRFPVLEANHYWYLLDRAGVHISTVAQGRLRFEDLGEWLKASVVQHGKAEYVKDLARNTARGMRKMKLEGRWLSCAPLGYRLENGRLQLGDSREVATVRRIFDMRTKGYGLYSIAKALNDSGTATVNGKAWQPVGVRHVLKRPAYIGHTEVGTHARGKHARILDGPVTIENTHPAIIDQGTWDAVQRMWSSERRAHARQASDGAPLAGLVRCGRCGEIMYAASGDKYVCKTYRLHGECGHCKVRRGPLLTAVTSKIRQHVLCGSRERLEAAIGRELSRRREKRTDDTDVRKQLAHLDQQIAKASDRLLVVADSLVPELEKRLLAMKDQRDQLAEKVQRPPAPQVSAKSVAARMWELDRILCEAAPTTVRHVLAQLIDHIRLDFVPVETNYKGQSYRFAGGLIQMRTQEVQQGTAL